MLRFPNKPEAAAVVGALGVEGYSVDFRGPLVRLSPGNVTSKDTINTVFDITEQVLARRRRFADKGPTSPNTANQTGNAMSSTDVLGSLGAMLLSGEVRIVDCTAVLGPDTPILHLPEDFAKKYAQSGNSPDQRI